MRARCAGLGLLFLAWVSGGLPSSAAGQVAITVTDLVPEFASFHEEARALEQETQRRAAAREVQVDSAALLRERRDLFDRRLGGRTGLLEREPGQGWVPTGLDEAWDRYPDLLADLGELGPAVQVEAADALREVASLLRLERPLQVHVVLYVGTFEDRPAFRLRGQEYALLLPVEALERSRRPMFIDLMTRAVHARLAGRPATGAPLSLAEHLAVRGLALRVYEALDPGRAAHEYLLRPESWLLEAERRDGEIMDWMRERLGERDPEALAPLLDGGGVTGLAGEFDYAAWRTSGLLLVGGWSLDRWAREPFGELGPRVGEALGG